MKFTKMHSCGNDFVILEQLIPADLAIRIANRRYGIGCDQLMCIHDGVISILNSDGSSASACGNGYRCVAQYLMDRGLPLCDGLRAWVEDDGAISVAQGVGTVREITQICGVSGTIVDMGNPHFVTMEDVSVFKADEISRTFPGGINVSVVSDIGDAKANVYVHERGAGPTMACATASCAVFTVLCGNGHSEPFSVCMPGGAISVWHDGSTVVHSAKAVTVCNGEICL